jgi:hypothetical protein
MNTACGIEDVLVKSKCGDKKKYQLVLIQTEYMNTKYLNSYMENNNRVFQWSELIEKVCTEEHVNSKFTIYLTDFKYADLINVRGKISWQFLYEDKIELKQNANSFEGVLSTGLKGAFPDIEGWFVPAVELYFPTKGSYFADEDYMREALFGVGIEADYNGLK